MSLLRRHGLNVYAALAAAYLLVPIAVIAIFSFAKTDRGTLTFAIEDGFTLQYWQDIFAIEELNDALRTSIELAAISTVVSTVIGTLMAIALVRHRFVGRRAANLLIILPMATPEIVIGASLLSLFIFYTFSLGFTTLVIAHIMFSISFVVVVVRSRLIGFDRSLEEAAQDLGATPFQTFRFVTLPLLWPGVAAAAMLAFALSLDDFVISDFNSGATRTFPLYVFGVSLRGIPIQVNAIATLLFIVTAIAILAVIWQQRRAERMATGSKEDETEPPRATRGGDAAPAPGVAGS